MEELYKIPCLCINVMRTRGVCIKEFIRTYHRTYYVPQHNIYVNYLFNWKILVERLKVENLSIMSFNNALNLSSLLKYYFNCK